MSEPNVLPVTPVLEVPEEPRFTSEPEFLVFIGSLVERIDRLEAEIRPIIARLKQ
jgi:hypothetical protein